MKISATYIVLLSLLAVACFKEDEPVSPYPGNVTSIADPVQIYTSYFDLESGRVINSHLTDTWQLGFECGNAGWHIITNSGAGWFIYNTNQNIPDAVVTIPQGINRLYDVQGAFPDSTAVGKWVSFAENGKEYSRNIYLLEKYSEGRFDDLIQLAFTEVSDTAYRFFYKQQNTGTTDTITVLKSDSVNFVYYSFDRQRQMNLEPSKTAYDLVFTSYYDLATLFGITIPYQVGGVLLNTWHTESVLDSTSGYANILSGNIDQYSFNSRRDVPGYRWKNVTVDVTGSGTATYTVKSHYSYVIRTAQNNYFKLRFLSYTLNGRSGFPQFEYRQLE